jgi:DNA-binding NarL/FixJ family response regulator
VVVGSSGDESKALRRAAGPDAQVVGMAESADEARALAGSTEADVFVIGAAAPGGRDLVLALHKDAPSAAVVWVGDDAPDQADASIPSVGDELESAITRALLARRAAGGTSR